MKPRQRARLIELLNDPEYRHEFFGSLISTSIAAQIKANRTDRDWSQKRLGEETGMKQSRISAMEDVNYQGWTIKTLRRLAEAFDVTLSVRFESFGKALDRFGRFQESLVEPPYTRDPRIHENSDTEAQPVEANPPTRQAPLLPFPAVSAADTETPADMAISPASKEALRYG